MVLSEQARRNWRIAAIVCSTIAGVHATFFTSYNLPINTQNDAADDDDDRNEGHVFTPIHKWVHEQKIKWYNDDNYHIRNNDEVMPKSKSISDDSSLSFESMSFTSPIDTTKTSSSTDPHLDNIAELRRIAKGHR